MCNVSWHTIVPHSASRPRLIPASAHAPAAFCHNLGFYRVRLILLSALICAPTTGMMQKINHRVGIRFLFAFNGQTNRSFNNTNSIYIRVCCSFDLGWRAHNPKYGGESMRFELHVYKQLARCIDRRAIYSGTHTSTHTLATITPMLGPWPHLERPKFEAI